MTRRQQMFAVVAVLASSGGAAAWYIHAHTPNNSISTRQRLGACRSARASFEGRDYLACVPKDARRVAVLLHGMLKGDPLTLAPQIMNRRFAWAVATGTAVIIPTANGRCDYLTPPQPDFLCWPNQKLTPEIEYLKRLIAHVSQTAGKRWQTQLIGGYSNGAYFLAQAVQQGQLGDFDRVGLLAGGSPDKKGAATDASPEVFVEIAKGDKWNAPWALKLVPKLRREGYRVVFRTQEGGHQYSADRWSSFLQWFGADRPDSSPQK